MRPHYATLQNATKCGLAVANGRIMWTSVRPAFPYFNNSVAVLNMLKSRILTSIAVSPPLKKKKKEN